MRVDVLAPIPAERVPVNQRDREALAESMWFLARTTNVRVEVQTDYLRRYYRKDLGTGMQAWNGDQQWALTCTCTQGKASVRLELKAGGVFLLTRAFDAVRIGRDVILREVLGTLQDRLDRPAGALR